MCGAGLASARDGMIRSRLDDIAVSVYQVPLPAAVWARSTRLSLRIILVARGSIGGCAAYRALIEDDAEIAAVISVG
jgi:hypothetical protein